MSKAAANILRSLSEPSRELLADALNKASAQELLQIKGIGPEKLAWLHNVCVWDLPRAYWPKFSVAGYGVLCKNGYALKNIAEVFYAKDIQRLLEHFQISVESDVNADLTELRDISARLEIFKLMNDPVIEDYLREMLVRLNFD